MSQSNPIDTLTSALIAYCLLSLTGCGAPTKPAEEVTPELSAALSLQQRLNKTCNGLLKDQTLKNNFENYSAPTCSEAGVYATDLRIDKRLVIQGIDDIEPVEADGTEYLSASTQTWIDLSLMRIALKLSKSLNANDVNSTLEENGLTKESLLSDDGQVIPLPEIKPYNFQHELITGEIGPSGRGEIALNPLRIYQPAQIKANGIISIDIKIDIIIKVEDESISLIVSTQDSSKNSFINDLQLSAIIIPYANQTYVHIESNLGAKTGGWANVTRAPIKKLIEQTTIQSMQDILFYID